jgi:D-ribose pyranase
MGIADPAMDVKMIRTGILNPAINSLICRVRHTNTLVIADRGFPFWPEIETVDISLVDDVPRVIDVLRAIRRNFSIGRVYVADEFRAVNSAEIRHGLEEAVEGVPLSFEPHVQLKRRVPHAIGLRTGDTIQYANVILESA